MSKQREITISGVGGQGMILCGTMIAEAAAIHDHKRATLSSEYGVETRGTFAKSDVIVSDEEIFFPDVTEPDLIICLAQVAYERYSGKTGDTLIIYNEAEVTPDPTQASPREGRQYHQDGQGTGPSRGGQHHHHGHHCGPSGCGLRGGRRGCDPPLLRQEEREADCPQLQGL